MNQNQQQAAPYDAEPFLALLTSMQAVADATIGYHKTLIEGGIPKDIAGEMSQRFAQAILDMMVSSVGSGPQQKPKVWR